MKPVKTDVQFPSIEESILIFWKEAGIVDKGLRVNEGKEAFVFYDGPPFATGLPHYGHILAGTLKDIVPRYWAMKGKYVPRRWGWDCHGLPVEFEMEKELGLNGLKDVENFGIAKFNEACRSIVTRYTEEWRTIITRTGRWADWDNGYRTMDPKFMESVWWIVKQLFDKGLIYEGHRVMPYSWRISTPLSNFEAGLNYKEVQDPALTLRFKSRDKKRSILAWTTTPWTLPVNLALAVSADIDYVELTETKTGEHLVLAKDRVATYFPNESEYTIVSTFKGQALVGEKYEPLFPHFANHSNAFRVLLGEHVTATDGTGIVHTAPAHGEDDFQVCKNAGIELVDATDAEGKFTALVPEYEGQNIKDSEKNIIKDLKAKGLIYKHDTLMHSYPFCWRSDTPLMQKAISTWFMKIDPIKPTMVASNKTTHWVPEHLRDGRFGNWLEAARDWNISRNRFWGTPIPIWRSEDGELHCVGSVDELEKLSGHRATDLHKHFIDDIVVKSPKTGKPMKRIPEVLDCWFESGSMPYAQQHYPFENKAKFEANFPAEFIAEGLDQTRGWFYTLAVLGSALFGKVPFKNVIVNGLVLAEDGKKMSKRLKNYPDPKHVLDTYGADALRAYLMSSPASHAEDLRFSEAGVKEIVRAVLLPFWNAYSFFVTYARADGWEPKSFKQETLNTLDNDLDRWVISRLQSLIQSVDDKMAVYHLHEVVPEVIGFIDQLTNWYIRLNRRRFWAEEKSTDKEAAYSTLYFTLTEFCKVLAPILPFVTDEIYRNLTEGVAGAAESVHLASFPSVHTKWRDAELEKQMTLVESVVSMGRNCRNTNKLKTRQPLRELRVITPNPDDKKAIESYAELLKAELNVKNVSFSADESQWVTVTAKANFKELGKRLGSRMGEFSKKLAALSSKQVAELQGKGKLEIDGETFGPSDIQIQRAPKQEGVIQTVGEVTLWIDTKLDDALIAEGRARELVSRVQKLRKDSGLDVSDRITLEYEGAADLASAFETHREYIASETLAAKFATASGGTWAIEGDIDGLALKVRLAKI